MLKRPNKYGLNSIDDFPDKISMRGVNERSLRTMAYNLGLTVTKDSFNKVFLITKKKEDE